MDDELDYDRDRVDETVLALLWLTMFEHAPETRAWKSHDWDALERLHSKGLIGDPRSKAKSVIVTAEGRERARELFQKLFGTRA